MKIIAFGTTGMVGYYLPKDITSFDLNDTDVTNFGRIEEIFRLTKPTHVIHLAAVTDVTGAETNQERCYMVNTMATYNIARLCHLYGAKLIFISSVDIFNGEKKTPYEVDDIEDPIVVYGHSKAAAEAVICSIMSIQDYLILRCSWMFGGFERDKKFVSYMMKQMLEGKKEIKAVNDVRGSVTYAKDLVSVIMDAIEKGHSGIQHVCSSGYASRYDEAKVIAKAFCYKGKVRAVSMKEFPNFRALKNACLVPSVKLPRWEISLTEYIQEWKKRLC